MFVVYRLHAGYGFVVCLPAGSLLACCSSLTVMFATIAVWVGWLLFVVYLVFRGVGCFGTVVGLRVCVAVSCCWLACLWFFY